MSEQVVDIRDRIEKMRDQMTDRPKSGVTQEKSTGKNKITSEKLNERKINSLNVKNKSNEKTIEQLNSRTVEKPKEEIYQENDLDKKIQENIEPKQIYSNYQNQSTFDKDKKSIKIDQDQPFPQFSLNVSNPISWKLMLLIMLMQLMTNIMLVVVLYLK